MAEEAAVYVGWESEYQVLVQDFILAAELLLSQDSWGSTPIKCWGCQEVLPQEYNNHFLHFPWKEKTEVREESWPFLHSSGYNRGISNQKSQRHNLVVPDKCMKLGVHSRSHAQKVLKLVDLETSRKESIIIFEQVPHQPEYYNKILWYV